MRKRYVHQGRSKLPHQRLLTGKHAFPFLRFRIYISVQMQKTMHHVPEKFSENRFSEFRSLPDSGIKADDDLSYSVSMRKSNDIRRRRIIQKTGMHIPDDVIGNHADFYFIQFGKYGDRTFRQRQHGRKTTLQGSNQGIRNG
nr:MAG TPA: hypothetical protein [Caudoviricetes sp.]